MIQINGFCSDFMQVLLNLISNPAEAIQESKTVPGEIPDEPVISIIENGGGIRQDVIASVFRPCFTTKCAVGTGLGSPLCKRITKESFAGTITAENEHEGAFFHILIPPNGFRHV